MSYIIHSQVGSALHFPITFPFEISHFSTFFHWQTQCSPNFPLTNPIFPPFSIEKSQLSIEFPPIFHWKLHILPKFSLIFFQYSIGKSKISRTKSNFPTCFHWEIPIFPQFSIEQSHFSNGFPIFPPFSYKNHSPFPQFSIEQFQSTEKEFNIFHWKIPFVFPNVVRIFPISKPACSIIFPGWLEVGPPPGKIWKSIGMMTFPIFLGKCQKWQPNHQPAGLSIIFPVVLPFFRRASCRILAWCRDKATACRSASAAPSLGGALGTSQRFAQRKNRGKTTGKWWENHGKMMEHAGFRMF